MLRVPLRVAAVLILASATVPALAQQSEPQPKNEIVVTGSSNIAVLTTLTKRGNQALAEGDISGARRLFQSAADAGLAAAMTGLAKTYDPVWLLKHRAVGQTGDAMKAVELYNKAATLGDPEAKNVWRDPEAKQ